MSVIVDPESPSSQDQILYRLRHSAAHVMAQAVLELFPEAKLAIGPPIEDGFYYDFDLPRPLVPDDLTEIEARMRRIIAEDHPFHYREVTAIEARQLFAGQPYKLELIAELEEGDAGETVISTYRQDTFEDLWRGPHLGRTGQIPSDGFALSHISGAYWRGDEQRPMLQRIYGTAWLSREDLEAHLQRLEEAKRRDHRRLGRELGLFFVDPIAPGSPFFLPKGATVYNLTMRFMRDLHDRYGYQEVITPQIYSTDLWKRSGHYDNYRENMYFIQDEDRELGVKPMNCPGHCVMFASEVRSYRELPIRYADFGRLHRLERSGALHGLTRVRSFSQDDKHIYCSLEQVETEIASMIEMMREAYDAFGLGVPRFTLSLRPEKRIGSEEMWDRAEAALRDALRASGMAFEEAPGEGAFYGPKIDLFMDDILGRAWQLSTFQLDFNMPERFNLHYVSEAGSLQRPVMLHCAILGSVERFLGILIEHTAGAFPVWLAPLQAAIIPVAVERHGDYATSVARRLKAAGIRAEADAGNERMAAKIREAQLRKVPYMLVVGDRERADDTVAVRLRTGENLGALPIDAFVERIRAETPIPDVLQPATRHPEQYPEASTSEGPAMSQQYLVIVEQAPENFAAYAPDLPGCVATGKSKEETLEAMREGIAFHLEGLRLAGQPIPPPTSSAEYMAFMDSDVIIRQER